MARPFSSTDAKRLITEHQMLKKQLEDTQQFAQQNISEIKKAADTFVAEEVLKVLRNVPVDELNRDKRGIRIKPLLDSGFYTIADIATASIYQIASVRGISEDTAYTIRRIVNDFVNQTRKETKIRISSDNRIPTATQLVRTIAINRRSQRCIDHCKKLYTENSRAIEYAIKDLTPATSSLRWLFASSSKKQKAIEAYGLLNNILASNYGREAKAELDYLYSVQNISNTEAWNDFSSYSIQFFNILENLVPGILGTGDADYGLPEDLAREIQDQCFFPDGLLCELRRYQEWGVKYTLHQEHVLMGDEMGLGKTVQAIATMVSLKNTGATHFVVVCPASVLSNWCREITAKSKLRVTKVHGEGRNAALKAWIKSGGVAVTTYETTNYFKLQKEFKFSLLVVDEAHYIKNPEAKRTKNVTYLCSHAERQMFMTGTALENRVDEMIALIQILRPDIAAQVKGIAYMSAAPQFRKKVAPVYLRRKREDVLAELPELIESKEWCTLTPTEELIYEEAVLNKNFVEARRVSWNVNDLCDSSKAKRLMELIEEAESEGRKAIVFSFFLDTIRKVTELLGNRCVNPINGSVSPQRRQEIIDEFEKAPAGTVLPAQILAGGTGLNIQAASVVIICEPQLKPSIENQAISRAYRMGQTRNVLVYRLLCENSIDEKIITMLEEKQAIFDAFADKSEAAKESIELDEKTIANIIQEEIEHINAKKRREIS